MPWSKVFLYLVEVGVTLISFLFARACFQISGASSAGVREFLEEFLSNWSLVDGQYYVLVGAGADVGVQDGCDRRYILEVDKYMEVVEVYAVTLLGMTLKDMDSAISWVEKSALPEERQRVKFKILHLMLVSTTFLNCLN